MAKRGGSLMRLKGLIRKEFLQIVRDPSSIAIAFVMPLFLLLLFGYGVSLDADHLPVALVAEEPSADTADFFASLAGSHYFAPLTMTTQAEAEEALRQGKVNAIVHLGANFAERLRRPEGAPIQLIVNGVDANTARLTQGYVEGAWGNWLARRATARGQALATPVQLEQRIWFNPEVKSRNFLVPGLVAIIMTLIGTLLTALVMAREWERGTLEALLVTPASMTEVLLGKLIAYFVLGTGGMLLTVGLAVFLFEVPLRGSFWVLWAAASLFLLAALGMGLTISSLARNQFVAGQIAIIGTFLPAFLLSGFLFDIDSMPAVVQTLTHLIVARYFVAIVQTLFLAGDVWAVVLPNAAALVVMAAFFLAVTWRKSRKRLE
ncbi:MAG TPA: ABC transporter permease [Thiobacillaceae bacterium]|nr:ABC transporter permease [Thiobacillaceae bacterium]HNF88741.1 ABC transporter permease [Thiobacillaceae bacterium]HNH88750.1 ABC transporter permease [Thiobacillaceae bacterium]HNI06750.1 ABC transporter permease [Thiobacillaceae bacterium]